MKAGLRGRVLVLGDEHVARAAHRADIIRFSCGISKLLAQGGNMHIHGAVKLVPLLICKEVELAFPREDDTWGAHESLKNGVFHVGEFQRPAAEGNLMRAGVEFQSADREDLRAFFLSFAEVRRRTARTRARSSLEENDLGT